MNIKEIEQISYVEKKLLISEMCLMYKKLKRTSKVITNKADKRGIPSDQKLNDSVYVNIMENKKVVSIFETILSLMSTEESMVIEKDFINPGSSTWHKTIWSKTTYYKIKHRAVDVFLSLMYV